MVLVTTIAMQSRRATAPGCLLLGSPASALASPGKLTVCADKTGPAISPLLYGLMTEEISHSYDGGLYGELIQNRAFADREVSLTLVLDAMTSQELRDGAGSTRAERCSS